MTSEKREPSLPPTESNNSDSIETPREPYLKLGFAHALRNTVNFVRVAPAQHLTALFGLGIMDYSGHQAANGFAEANYGSGIFWSTNLLVSLTTSAASEWVAANSLNKYERLKKDLERFGWDERLIKPHIRTWCGRHIARIAAIDCGFRNEVDKYYSRKDYKWYHFKPDEKRG